VIHPLTMPKWGLSMTEGKICGWLVQEGVEVTPGVELVEVETEKILSSLEATVSGTVRRIVARTDDMVPVGGLVAVIADAPVDDREIDAFIDEFQARFAPGKVEAEFAVSTMRAQVGGYSLSYLKRGSGAEGALLIHGFGGDLNSWSLNHDALTDPFSVYALDLRGHGESSKQVGSGTLDEFAADLGGFMDAVNLRKAHLVGHSIGGAIATKFALAYPARVSSLVLIASAGLGAEIDVEFINGFISSQRRKDLMPHMEKLFADKKRVTRQLVENILMFKRLDNAVPSLLTIARQFCPTTCQAVILRDQLSTLGMPVAVIWGADDRIIPASHARGLPDNVRVMILPDSGHMVHMEAARTVNRLIAEFWHRPAVRESVRN
jgi:pyruvate dehydrogenase E2 component (dihydrolipoamide acetyltransferase)